MHVTASAVVDDLDLIDRPLRETKQEVASILVRKIAEKIISEGYVTISEEKYNRGGMVEGVKVTATVHVYESPEMAHKQQALYDAVQKIVKGYNGNL